MWDRGGGAGPQHCERRGRKTVLRAAGKGLSSSLPSVLLATNTAPVSHPAASPFSQTVIEVHGETVVESLVPIFVWVLEGLASCKAQLRDREEEAEREKTEREALLERYQAERTLRKESQEVGEGGSM